MLPKLLTHTTRLSIRIPPFSPSQPPLKALLHHPQKFSTTKTKTPPPPSIHQVQQLWNSFSSDYNKFDYCPQTLYYSLLYMLEVWDSGVGNILQVACGTGKLLPVAVGVKNRGANYLAVDLSTEMVQLTKKNLKQNLQLYDSKLNFQQWLQKNKLTLSVANAEQPLPKFPHIGKFDRIICNCVVMLTHNPQAMLRNLYKEANENCLLGVSVWGSKQENNLMMSIREAYLEAGVDLPQQRSNFHLYKKLTSLAEKCGWQTVLNWQQNALFPALSPNSQKYRSFFHHQVSKIEHEGKRQEVKKILDRKLEKFFGAESGKRGINFSCEMAVFRKKGQ